MPDLLLELRSEEIPARMQRKAAGDLKKVITDGLVEAGLTYEAAREYWTPRRLALDIRGLTARSKDVRDEIKGPAKSAPEQAIQGFLRKAGLNDISEAHLHSDPKKGEFYVAHIVKPGRAAEEVIAELVPAAVRAFPWPKSMRWGKASAKPGSLRWVRPLQSILCTFGPETSEPVVVDFEVDGIRSGNVTYGHRFHAPEAITVRRFDDYVSKLEAAKVVLDAERRKEMILADAKNLAFASGLSLVEDEGLLEEVSGLVEWPVVLMGEFEQDLLSIPAEVIRLTIRANQKCFVTRATPTSPLWGGRAEGAGGGVESVGAPPPLTPPHKGEGDQAAHLSNHFILTSNIEARDGGREIAHGNGKVVRARLSDALYFWKTDQSDLPDLDGLRASAEKFGLNLKKPLDQRMARLDRLGVTFHAKLGTQGERVERIRALAVELAPVVKANPMLVDRAAVLAKADLQTEVVGEFPELQGAMGRKYALLQGEEPSVAAALEEHYKPQGPSDRVPTDPVSVAVALADKLDVLSEFWSIEEKPTGSKDPYALRRASLGVIRILIENQLRVPITEAISAQRQVRLDYEAAELRKRLIDTTLTSYEDALSAVAELQAASEFADEYVHLYSLLERKEQITSEALQVDPAIAEKIADAHVSRFTGVEVQTFWILARDLLSFFHDRLKVYLRDQGARHDLIDAVITPTSDDLLMIVRRVEALGSFLATDDGKNLLAGAKRAANILAAEEKKGTRIAAAVEAKLFKEETERGLFAAVNQAEKDAGQAIQNEDFSGAMRALSALREPVDSFFEKVLVNDPDESVRANRLALLARIRAATGAVADFSKIAG